jgi:hypothetical protein
VLPRDGPSKPAFGVFDILHRLASHHRLRRGFQGYLRPLLHRLAGLCKSNEFPISMHVYWCFYRIRSLAGLGNDSRAFIVLLVTKESPEKEWAFRCAPQFPRQSLKVLASLRAFMVFVFHVNKFTPAGIIRSCFQNIKNRNPKITLLKLAIR